METEEAEELGLLASSSTEAIYFERETTGRNTVFRSWYAVSDVSNYHNAFSAVDVLEEFLEKL